MAGGKKLPELEALEMAYRAVQEGAAGVDMGRNIFQSRRARGDDPGRREGRARRRAPGRGVRALPGARARGHAPDADDGPRADRRRPEPQRRHAHGRPAASRRRACSARRGRDRARPRRRDGRRLLPSDDGRPTVREGAARPLRQGRPSDDRRAAGEGARRTSTPAPASSRFHVESTRHPHRVLQ